MTPSIYQRNIYEVFQTSEDNINISAVAGSGKTTVLLELLKLVPKNKTALFMAFNNSIVDELKNRIRLRDGVEITTIHSYGWHAIMRRYGSRVKMNPNKALGKIEKALKKHTEIDSKKRGWFFYIYPTLFCRLIKKAQIRSICDRISLRYRLPKAAFARDAQNRNVNR